ncbi:hypothetical protein HNP92_000908 [Methanococcus maripaludis]|uniref:Uncharacterized protein n=1 Tax=Methanococcus maripaludis TaxID=39152 RepID=A0A2L1C9B8_METMI|nr:hypothetical protein [Methanococcus maripaludis]AVB75981.1 hypothetical protein MMJJ_05640 [Methanococcus maripaludis]MBB6401603.1 hypothetical protein [Methanococcus maripaludis]
MEDNNNFKGEISRHISLVLIIAIFISYPRYHFIFLCLAGIWILILIMGFLAPAYLKKILQYILYVINIRHRKTIFRGSKRAIHTLSVLIYAVSNFMVIYDIFTNYSPDEIVALSYFSIAIGIIILLLSILIESLSLFINVFLNFLEDILLRLTE